MLVYEIEGSIEVEPKDIKQICRSTNAVSFGDVGGEACTLQAVLCQYLDNSELRCSVALYAKTLKRAFIFSVKSLDTLSSWSHGQEILSQQGFQLEDVNLRLSPAMLEVVLRDIHGLDSADKARQQRAEKKQLLAEFQETYDKNPDSSQGKKAAIKLSAEKRLNDHAEELRCIFEQLFSPATELEVLLGKMKELSSRLEAAETLAEAERKQREMSESITAAAEKRIQELEEVLVDVETKAALTLKHKRKISQLQKQIKSLDENLKSAEDDAEKGRQQQAEFILEAGSASERITLLEKDLVEAKKSLEKIQVQRDEEQAEKTRLDECFKAAELRIITIEKDLESAEKKAILSDEAVKTSEGAQAQLADVQQALEEAHTLNKDLQENLATAVGRTDALENDLKAAEKVAQELGLIYEQMAVLTEEKEQLALEFRVLHEEYDKECLLRKSLENNATKDEQRIGELEDSLARLTQQASAMAEHEKGAEQVTQELESLKLDLLEQQQRFQEEQRLRQELDEELCEAHKCIDSLEKMNQENEKTAAARLLEVNKSFESIQVQRDEEQTEKTRLDECLKAAELRIKALSMDLESAEKKAVLCDEAVKTSEGVQVQLIEVQQALEEAHALNKDMQENLATTVGRSVALEKGLQVDETIGQELVVVHEKMAALAEEKTLLAQEFSALREEYDKECHLRKELEKNSKKDEQRIGELEDSLARLTQPASEMVKHEKGAEQATQELESLKLELLEQQQRFQVEQRLRQGLDDELCEANKCIDSLEQMIRENQKAAAEKLTYETQTEGDDKQVQELVEKLRAVENQLEQERTTQKKLAKAVVAAELKLTEKEEQLAQRQVVDDKKKPQDAAVDEVQHKKPAKPLPHELRPAPKKGALFHPDWDLEGLPCQSSEQIFKVWEAAFNVQISLEGYPSQYCTAFLVVLLQEKQKKLYLLYRLKKNKHTLICVPANTPNDEASLKKAIKDVLMFLKKSGFEMAEMGAEHIDGTLKKYFL